jgi:hypothetical protein
MNKVNEKCRLVVAEVISRELKNSVYSTTFTRYSDVLMEAYTVVSHHPANWDPYVRLKDFAQLLYGITGIFYGDLAVKLKSEKPYWNGSHGRLFLNSFINYVEHHDLRIHSG